MCIENLIRVDDVMESPKLAEASVFPWQNGFAERLIGSIRRECLDHIVVFGEAHLRRILRSYACYYNESGPIDHWIKMRRFLARSSGDPGRTPSPLRPGLNFRYTQ